MLESLEVVADNMRSFSRLVTWSDILTYGFIGLVTYVSYRLFIQPFLSPLRKVPGLRYIPIVGNLRYITSGEAMETSIEMMRDFGGVMRYYFFMGGERLMVTDPSVMKHICVNNSRNYIKPRDRFKLLRIVLGDGLVTSEGALHAVHKRLMAPSFNQNSIRKMIPVFEEMAQKLCDHWMQAIGDEKSARVSVHEDLTLTTLDIIGKTAFGYEFNALTNPEVAVNQKFQKILSGSGLNWRFLVPVYFDLPFPDVLEFKRAMKVIMDTVNNIIDKKRRCIEKGQDVESVTKDCLGMMMMARDESTGRGMSDKELRDQVITLMLAGHETTAVAMAWCLLVLAQHPDVQTRAREEILSVFPRADVPMTWERLEKLDFCNCIVKETLRMYPPVPLTLRQSVDNDVLQDKYFVPKGTIILMSMGPMMRNEKLFEDPDTFRPERFYEKEANESIYHFLPFLIGSRMCLGYKFAQLEMKALLVALLRQLEYQPIAGQSYKRKLRTTMRPDPALELSISRANVD